jgi:hypothetical protein
MKQRSSWQTNGSSASLEIPCILRNQKVPYQKVANWPYPKAQKFINASPSHVFKTNFNIILPYTPRSSMWLNALYTDCLIWGLIIPNFRQYYDQKFC